MSFQMQRYNVVVTKKFAQKYKVVKERKSIDINIAPWFLLFLLYA
jgi:hypothetical protein